MRVGLIDVDGHNFPNLPLMKISAYHKSRGDSVEWYEPLFSGHMDKVYMSKVFTFTPDYPYCINADEIIKGGTGYSYPDGGEELPEEIEHIYPDYQLYKDAFPDTAYGFLTRGCPRGCDFCIVGKKEGRCARKVADLSEFWNGQKNIVLLDANMFACKEWKDLSVQLIESGAWVDSRVIHEFYQTYRPLQKRYNLRLHSHFDVYGNDYIEIWEYKGDVRGSRICMVKEEGEVACYRRAIEELKNYEGNRKDRSNEKRAG